MGRWLAIRVDEPSSQAASAGRPRNFVRPCLLLLLSESADHGYDLVDRLRGLLGEAVDAGGVYRCLRGLEHENLVVSGWRTCDGGPARRVYELTGDGHAALASWAETVRDTRDHLDRYLARYAETPAIHRSEADRGRVVSSASTAVGGR